MKSLPWVVAVAAVVIAVVGTNKLQQRDAKALPETPARLLAAAASDLEKKRPVDALRKLRRIPASDRLALRAKEVEGVALLSLHFAGRAEERLLEALTQDPTLNDAPYRLFDLYFLSGRHAATRRLAVELAPKQVPTAAAAMLLETIRQEHERAATPLCLEIFEPVLVREPENGHALRAVGRCFVELGRVTEGLRLLKQATEKLPEDGETWAVRMESMLDAGRAAEVVRTFATTPETVRKHPRTLRVVAAALDADGDLKNAEHRLQDALAADPFDRKSHAQLAGLLARRGASAEARKHEDRAKELDDLRERQAALLQEARGMNNDPGPDLLRRLADVCTKLGWTDVGRELAALADRRSRSAAP
jgi:tetratricopeptide (TPR) repeat protein